MTEKEREVGVLLVRGLSTKEIADHLQIGFRKAAKYRESLYLLLRVHCAAEAAQALIALGVASLAFVATD